MADDRTDQHLTIADEGTVGGLTLDQTATPYATESIAQYFDSPHAPDLVILQHTNHRFHGNPGEHGSLLSTQARAPFMAAGPGVIARGIIDEHLRTVDVAPTVMALLGAARIDGVDGLGAPRSGIRLKVQDGKEVPGLIDEADLPDHVVLCLWDGCNPAALHAAAERGDAPNVAALIERGTSFRHGAYASLPTATLANHMTESTGVLPGHTGVLHNTWHDRRTGTTHDLLDFRQMVDARGHLRSDIETIHEALHRNEPHARSAATYEYGDRGADWSTYAQMASRGPQGPLSDDARRRHRTADWMGNEPFRQFSGFDAQSLADARHVWSGALGALPRFSWVTFNLTDTSGHEAGPHGEMTTAAITDTDGRFGELLDTIDQAGVLDRTAVILCADHGMQYIAESEAFDLGQPLKAAGVDHLLVDAQYVYLTNPAS